MCVHLCVHICVCACVLCVCFCACVRMRMCVHVCICVCVLSAVRMSGFSPMPMLIRALYTQGKASQKEPSPGPQQQKRAPNSKSLSFCGVCSLREEETHEKHTPSQGKDLPTSRCYRCCDPGMPVYQTIPPPQINITILKGEKAAEMTGGTSGGAALYPRRGRSC